eukprot:6038458-Pyramimonas_sp.AAC.1
MTQGGLKGPGRVAVRLVLAQPAAEVSMLGVGRTLWKTEPVASEISASEKASRPWGSGGACCRRPHRTACVWSASGTS